MRTLASKRFFVFISHSPDSPSYFLHNHCLIHNGVTNQLPRGEFFKFGMHPFDPPEVHNRKWDRRKFHYDNVPTALLTLFAVQTTEVITIIIVIVMIIVITDIVSRVGLSCSSSRWQSHTKTKLQSLSTALRCPSSTSSTSSSSPSSSSTSLLPSSSSPSKSKAKQSFRRLRLTRIR